jgi:NADH:ubiquinone oxidoreductase subunit 6 (subunit J)
VYCTFGDPAPDLIGTVLFTLFALGAVVFGTVLVVQRNPARGAIAFAFVILSTCGLFLLLAAPFLMAATIIIYAGAIIVTFLFVLMLSQAAGPSDENDRSREPLLGSLAGFAFAGLVLFSLYQSQAAAGTAEMTGDAAKLPPPLPAPVITPQERDALVALADRLKDAEVDSFYGDPVKAGTTHRARAAAVDGLVQSLETLVGVSSQKAEVMTRDGSIQTRLAGFRFDAQAKAVLEKAAAVRDLGYTALRKVEMAIDTPLRATPDEAKADVRKLREEVTLLGGSGLLPARNVGNLGLLLFADHLLAVELAGTLLLVATIGAIAVAHRKGAAR